MLLELTATVSATDAVTQITIYGSGITRLLISNEESSKESRIMIVVQSIEDSDLFIKAVSKAVENEAK